MTDSVDHPLWDYAVEVYGRAGVSGACIGLQQRLGLDVNVLLFCCWLGAGGHGEVPLSLLEDASERTGPWNREIVGALRAVRNTLKGGFAPAPGPLAAGLRDRIIAVETEAERVEMSMLGELVPGASEKPAPEPERAALANLLAYCKLRRVKLGEEDREDLLVLLTAAFADADRKALSRLIAGAAS